MTSENAKATEVLVSDVLRMLIIELLVALPILFDLCCEVVSFVCLIGLLNGLLLPLSLFKKNNDPLLLLFLWFWLRCLSLTNSDSRLTISHIVMSLLLLLFDNALRSVPTLDLVDEIEDEILFSLR